ncbi:aldo/keto reductase [Caldicellulosiruptor acetigenus I77R1B]|uniref:Aldo/keto reductase n=1 Tax=Caldicellulosiruptor acetigenus (strain ATCC 700853 / DSM 12137 / I77R1B) TaxID=632335 RepID=E4S812_CALA7|nr:aldo/keto reductase [Caldicellulosiruptor acetigenus]ADQ41912.1 aldo/keto reductase [Caldicellulosiruptor acetigenus I77R1B]
MLYRKFGNTGVMISALGFGAMRLPQKEINGKMVFDEDESIKIIHRAVELGVNYIDTAPYYCDSQSEIIVGKALKGIKNKVYISTKNPIEDDSGDNFLKRLENSLKKLDVDKIDFYHMWGINYEAFREKIIKKGGPLDAAKRAKEEGLIGHISFSFHDKPENMIKIIDEGEVFETVLCQYNLLDRSNEKAIEYAAEKGLGVVVMGPVGGGRLGAPSPVIQNLLPGKVVSSAEIALRFVLANPNVSCALSGMSTIEMVEQNAKVASNPNPLSSEELELIKKAMEENKKLADLYCTGCNYCMPCPQGVNIPLNFQIMNYHRVYGLTDFAKAEYARIGTVQWLPGKKAEECIECGICEEKCPQKIQIRKQLKETAQTLGAK